MKARRKEEQKPKNRICLSIGMIVKNEEAHLENCLQAMTTLREAVPSELIIVDTGSTDQTVEIAKRYADQVLHFEWCDDFSAARNVSLEAASGEWFLYIDADEILEENCTPLIEFLKMPQNPYGTASLIQRNYLNQAHSDYTDFHMMRLFRNIKNIKFYHLIHECIRPFITPTKDIPVIAHHDGYVHGINAQKQKRNQKLLLQELETDPDNLRTLRHLVDTYSRENFTDVVEKNNICWKIISLCEKNKQLNNIWVFAYHTLIFTALNFENYLTAQELLNEYFQKKGPKDIAADVDMRYCEGLLLFNTKEYSAAKDAYLEYQRLYQLYHNGQLETEDIYTISFTMIHPRRYAISCYMLAKCWQMEKNYPQMRAALERAGAPSELLIGQLKERQQYEFLYARESGDYSRLTWLFEQVAPLNQGDGWLFFVNEFEAVFSCWDARKQQACNALSAVESENPFILLCRLRTTDDAKMAQALLSQLSSADRSKMLPCFADILYCAAALELPLPPVMGQFEFLLEEKGLAYLTKQRDDFGILLTDILRRPLEANSSLTNCCWHLRLIRMLLTSAFPISEQAKQQLSQQYFTHMGDYLHRLYQPEVFLAENLLALPIEHRFFAELEHAPERTEDYLVYLRELLQKYPQMAPLVQLRLAQLEQELLQPASEFAALAKQVKEQFYSMLLQEQTEQAQQVLTAYQGINPSDPEIAMMRIALISPKEALLQ